MNDQRVSKLEKAIQTKIIKWLNAQPATWCFKSTGHLRGIPDVTCCHRGAFYVFEVKVPGNAPTPIQQATMRQIRAAKGEAHVVFSLDDVKRILGE